MNVLDKLKKEGNKKEYTRFPLTEFQHWNVLKEEYKHGGYDWVDLDYDDSVKNSKKVDTTNDSRYASKKKDVHTLHKCLRSLNTKLEDTPVVTAPPKPSNHNRASRLKTWRTRKPAFDISLATIKLFTEFAKEPCKDYEPQEAVEVYLRLKNSTEFKKGHRRQRSMSEPMLSNDIPNDQLPAISVNERRHSIEQVLLYPTLPSAPPKYTPQDSQTKC